MICLRAHPRENDRESSRNEIGDFRFCTERQRAVDLFVNAAQEMHSLLGQQIEAARQGDADLSRFDTLLHLAQERKDLAKYAWLAHIEKHRCGEA